MYQYKVITDLITEPVSLEEAKEFMQIDYSDFDSLIELLIKSARVASENVTGLAYGAKVIGVTGNDIRTGDCIEKVYPVLPYVSDVSGDNVDYEYNAGFDEIPADLKGAILMRVATGFAYRQNGISEAINKTVNASIVAERQNVKGLCV